MQSLSKTRWKSLICVWRWNALLTNRIAQSLGLRPATASFTLEVLPERQRDVVAARCRRRARRRTLLGVALVAAVAAGFAAVAGCAVVALLSTGGLFAPKVPQALEAQV